MLTMRVRCVAASPDDGKSPQKVTFVPVDSADHAQHFSGAAGGTLQFDSVRGAPFKAGEEYDVAFGPVGHFGKGGRTPPAHTSQAGVLHDEKDQPPPRAHGPAGHGKGHDRGHK